MNTTKALVLSVVLLILIAGLQLCRQYAVVWGIPFMDATNPTAYMVINLLSGLLGIAVLSVWWVRFFVTREQDYPMGSVSVNEPTVFPTATVDAGDSTLQGQPAAKAPAPAPATVNYMDVARMGITLSDGRTQQLMRMRVDTPKEVRVSIGNSRNCGIHIKDSTLAPHHADLLIHSGMFKLYNPGHNNGVRVGKKTLPAGETASVMRGQKITLGAVTIVIE